MICRRIGHTLEDGNRQTVYTCEDGAYDKEHCIEEVEDEDDSGGGD
jgi:hypothetical protein